MKITFLENRPLALLGLFGVPLLIFTILMEMLFPVNAPEGYKSFIVAFEFTKTPEQLYNLFNGYTPKTLSRIDSGNTIDFGFMMTYSMFLILFFWKAVKIFHQKWPFWGILLTVIVFFADVSENVFLLRITNLYSYELQGEQLTTALRMLHIVTWIKWGGLAVIFALFSVKTMGKRALSTFEGVIFIFPLLMSFWALTGDPTGISNFTLSIIVAFALLIFYSIRFRSPENETAGIKSHSKITEQH